MYIVQCKGNKCYCSGYNPHLIHVIVPLFIEYHLNNYNGNLINTHMFRNTLYFNNSIHVYWIMQGISFNLFHVRSCLSIYQYQYLHVNLTDANDIIRSEILSCFSKIQCRILPSPTTSCFVYEKRISVKESQACGYWITDKSI